MSEWWSSLDILMKMLYCIAVPASVLLLIQTVISLLGFGDNGAGIEMSDTSGLDLDSASDINDIPDISDMPAAQDGSNPMDFSALRLFTLQGMIAFFTVFSWTSIVSINSGTPAILGILIGLVLGFAVMVLVAKLIRVSAKLAENGTLNIKNCIGEIGEVYIPVPANNQGKGKIVINVQGRLAEIEAVTLSDTTLSSNTAVRVTDVYADVVVVEEYK